MSWWSLRKDKSIEEVSSHPIRQYSESSLNKGYIWRNSASLLKEHQQLLTALRIESGYNTKDFQYLILDLIDRYASFVHLLPATRSLHHREEGGLLRFGIEVAFTAFRRADGRLFNPESQENKTEKERAWRYTAFLGGICLHIGKVITQVRVTSENGKLVWNPYQSGILEWLENNKIDRYHVMWRDKLDERPLSVQSIWLSARLVPMFTVNYLYEVDPVIPETLLNVIGGHKDQLLGDILSQSEQATIDQELSHVTAHDNSTTQGVSLHHRLVDAIRGLVKEKWSINVPSGRLWITNKGVFIIWKAAVEEIRLRLRSEGVGGIPSSADTLAELLLEKEFIEKNTYASNNPAYFAIKIHGKGIPKSRLYAVKITNPGLLGINIDNTEAAEIELMDFPPEFSGQFEDDTQVALDFDKEQNAKKEATQHNSPGEVESLSEVGDSEDEEILEQFPPDKDDCRVQEEMKEKLKGLNRYGKVGEILKRVAIDSLSGNLSGQVFMHPDGVGIAFPEVIRAYTDTSAFIKQCKNQNLIVLDVKNKNKHIYSGRKREKEPQRYILLNERFKKLFFAQEIVSD